MKKLLLGSSAFLTVMSLVVLSHGPALALPPEDLDQEKAQLRKENSDLREMLRMREENAALRRRLGQTSGEALAPLPKGPSPRMQATAPSPPSETFRTEPVPRRASRSVFEALAADMPVKATPPMQAGFYNWTGFYVGANIGYSVGNDRISSNLQAVTPGGPIDTPQADFVSTPKGVLGGVQVGYNWQAGRNWLAGFEADIQAANQTDKACSLECALLPQGINGTTITAETLEQKLQWFGTMRGRLGIVSDNVLFYGTGGAAFGHVNQTAVHSQSVINGVVGNGAFVKSGVAGETLFGWTAGGGIEAALSGNWTLKAEYLYMNLGDMKPNAINSFSPTNAGGGAPVPIVFTTSSTIRDHIVRLGVNYRLGGDAPLSAYGASASPRDSYAYAPVAPYNWTGFYAGGNAGYGQGVSRLSEPSSLALGSFLGSSTADSVIAAKGFLGGVQIGYNLQGGRNWLVGFEADIQGTNQSDKACTPLLCFVQAQPGNPNILLGTTMQQQLDWFATARGRVGVVNNNILFYGTAGVAFGQVKQTVDENFINGPTSNLTSITTSHNMTGWTAGGGIEAALWGNWTAKAEYLYLDLGNIKSTFDDGSTGTPGTGVGRIDNSATFRDHIFRAGINYRFSGEPAAITASY